MFGKSKKYIPILYLSLSLSLSHLSIILFIYYLYAVIDRLQCYTISMVSDSSLLSL